MKLMKAVKKTRRERGVEVTSSEVPVINDNEVLIKVNKAGICGTDYHIYLWDKWSQSRIIPPVIIGHEFVGKIVSMGKSVTGFNVGQRVSAEGHITCGHCIYCRNGKAHLCQKTKVIGIDRDGCFADYIKMPAENVWTVPDEIDDKYAVLFDPLGNAMHTVMTSPVNMKTVLITGAGSIGLFAIPIAKINGASKIIVIEPNEFKQELASKLGADEVISPTEPNIESKVLSLTNGIGADVFLEMSGNMNALKTGLKLLSNGGSACLLGIPSRDIPINLANEIIFKGVTIHGITGRRMYETWYQCQNFLLKYASLLDPIITHNLELSEIEKGFKLIEQGKGIKIILNI